MADHAPKPERQEPSTEQPGDTNAADIVDRHGEQMPLQSHDGLEAEERSAVREDDVDAAEQEGRL